MFIRMYSTVTNILEGILYGALGVFVISTLYLVQIVKKKNMELVKGAVTNPLLPNFDLSFFSKLRAEYEKISKSKLLTNVHMISFYVLILGVALLFVLVVSEEFLRY